MPSAQSQQSAPRIPDTGTGEKLLPEHLSFRKIWSHRNLFTSKIDIATLDLKQIASDTAGPIPSPIRKTHTQDGLQLHNIGNSDVSFRLPLGQHIPCGIYELGISDWTSGSSAGIDIRKDDNNRIVLTCVNHVNGQTKAPELRLEVYVQGVRVIDKVLSKARLHPPFTIKADFIPESIGNNIRRCFLSVWEETKEKHTLLDYKIDIQTDFSNPSVVETYRGSLVAGLASDSRLTLSGFDNAITGGAAQADPKPLHDETGTILQEGDSIWLAMSVRGYDIHSSYQGIYRLNLKTGELNITGILLFNPDNRNHYATFHAADIIYNSITQEWIAMPTAHNERPHAIKSGLIPKDPRHTPFQCVPVTSVQYPDQSNEEDASLIYDRSVGKWRLVMCDSSRGGYQIPLLESDTWNGSYREIARYTQAPCTGIQFQKLDGNYYVFFGRNVDNCEVLRYPSMNHPVRLNIQSSPRSYNVWPVIIPFRNADTNRQEYYMLSFDRETHGGAHSYGNLYLYRADVNPCKPTSEGPMGTLPPPPIVNGEIRTASQLMQIRNNPSGHYTLKNNIDLASISDWIPIGDIHTPFSGTFDGAGFTISNLNVKRPGNHHNGLFGYIGKGGLIKNLHLSEATIEGYLYTGALAGTNDGTIDTCSAKANIHAFSVAGGLVGQNNGIITHSSTSGDVASCHGDSIGGLVGVNCANTAPSNAIDLATQGVLSDCSSNARVTGILNVGGLVGHNDCGSISHCQSQGNIRANANAGGLVGTVSRNYGNPSTSPIAFSHASGDVTGTYNTGGLIGMNDGSISQCSSSGSVTGNSNTSPFIGTNHNNSSGKLEE